MKKLSNRIKGFSKGTANLKTISKVSNQQPISAADVDKVHQMRSLKPLKVTLGGRMGK